jgi:hypothetical protein
MTLRLKLMRFLGQSLFVQLWFIPAWFMLGTARLLILSVNFKRLAPMLGHHNGKTNFIPLLDQQAEERVLDIGRVVRMASSYTPWRSNCFPQAIASRWLLGIYGIPYVVCFGLAPGESSQSLDAHAWVSAGRICVSGGESSDGYTVVAVFIDPTLARQITL